ncbi:MAG: hypothetical protein JW829_20170, partial [Pirellulales bacterium]|nr:hypothetical protein [Pirellulales bacterium]
MHAAEQPEDRWNLGDIYPTEEAWRQAKDDVKDRLGKISDYQGRLGESPQRLLECLEATASVRKEVQRIFSYASMLSDEDTRVDRPAQMRAEAQLLQTDLSRQISFIKPEILAIGVARIDTYQAQEPRLQVYQQFLRDVLRQTTHTRSREVEQVIAEVGRIATAPSDVRRTLANADIPWPTIVLSDGGEVFLDPAGYTKYRAVPNRDDRKRVFDAFWKAWKVYERTLGMSLYSQLNRDHFYGQVRNYPNSLAAALGSDNIPEDVYHTLIRQTNANLDTLHRYFKLRARMLGLEDPAYHDIYPPLVETDLEFPLERAK